MKTTADGSILAHKFEARGLGVAPFRYVGMSENVIRNPDGSSQAGGCCDYCYTGIRYQFHVKDSTGKTFKVGCDCIRHAFNNNELTVVVESEMRRIKRLAAQAKRQAKALAEQEKADSLLPEYRAALAKLEAQPHPHPYFADQGKTLADWYRFFEFGSDPKNQRAPLGRVLGAIKAAQEAQ